MSVTYIVEQGTSATGPWVAVSGSPFSVTADIVSGLQPSTQYWFRITAQDIALGLTATPSIVGPVTTGNTGGSLETSEGTNVTTVGPTISASTVPGTAAPSGPFNTFALNASGNVLRNGTVDVGPGGGTSSPTWLASTAVGPVTVSGQTLTLTGVTGNVRANMATPTAGVNWYVEITTPAISAFEAFGIVMPAWLTNDTNDTPGDFNDSVAILGDQSGGASIYNSGKTSGSALGLVAGGIVGIAYQAATNTVYFSINGNFATTSATANPVTGVGGFIMTGMTPPYTIGFGDFGGHGADSVVLNAGQSAFVYQPTGYPAPTIAAAPTATTRLFYHNHTTYQEIPGLATTFSQPGWFSDNGSPGSWAPSNSPLPANETITIASIGQQTANQAFTVTGQLTNYPPALSPPSLQYADGSGGFSPIPAAGVTQNTFSFTHPGLAASTAVTTSVRDLDNQSITATSNVYQVTGSTQTGMTALVKSTINPRYAATADGNSKFLCASHTWDAFQTEPPATLNWSMWLNDIVVPEVVVSANCAPYVRFWLWMGTLSDATIPDSEIPWLRSSTPGAGDGNNLWDLSQFNPTFFSNLTSAVALAESFGVYCQILLFGNVVQANNVFWNNIQGNYPSGGWSENQQFDASTGSGSSATTLQYQKAFAVKMAQTLSPYPNVTWEIGNEITETTGTQGFISTIAALLRSTEAAIPGGFVHLVTNGAGGNYPGQGDPSWGGSNPTFTLTELDMISSGWGDSSPYRTDVGVTGVIAAGGPNGNQVVLLDTDHGLLDGSNNDSVWRSLCYGWGGFLQMSVAGPSAAVQAAQNPAYGPNAFLSGNDNELQNSASSDASAFYGMLGVSRALSLLAAGALNRMSPNSSLSSTGFCLADTSTLQYVVYDPSGSSSFTVNLSAGVGTSLRQQWIDATTGQFLGASSTFTATASQSFTPPANGGSVGLVLVPGGGTPESITVTSPGPEVVNNTFTVNATLIGYLSAPSLDYSLDNATWTAIPAAGITTTTASFSLVIAAAATYNVWVRDHNQTTITGESPAFVVSPQGTTIFGSPGGAGGTFMDTGGIWPTRAQYQAAAGFRNPVTMLGVFQQNLQAGFAGPPYNLENNNSSANIAAWAAANCSFICGGLTTCGLDSTLSGFTPVSVVAGTYDAQYNAWIQNWYNDGFSTQKGYTGTIWVRMNWEQNIPFTTPGNYCGQESWSNHGVTGACGSSQYWFNSGSNSPVGGSPTTNAGSPGNTAGSCGGNYFAWVHIYNLLSINSPVSNLSKTLGVPIKIVWNPDAYNGSGFNDGGQGVYGNAHFMYPGDGACDAHGVDIYADQYYPLDLYDYPGYASAPSCSRLWPRGALNGSQEAWAHSASAQDNFAHYFDFTDSQGGIPDGYPPLGQTDYVGANSAWGWSISKAIDFATVTGMFAGIPDVTTGRPRVPKPLIWCESGTWSGDYGSGCGNGSVFPDAPNGPDGNTSAPRPAWMGGVGASENLNFWPRMSLAIARCQSLGITVPGLIGWTCASGTIQSARMMATMGSSFTAL